MKARHVAIVLVALASLSCGTNDPDAATRDKARDQSRVVAQSITLPSGYEITNIQDDPAQTPKENRGGGQGGSIDVHYKTSSKTTGEVLQELDAHFAPRAIKPIKLYGAKPQCTKELLAVAWANDTYAIKARYDVEGHNGFISVPYDYSGPVTVINAGSTGDVTLPTCPS